MDTWLVIVLVVVALLLALAVGGAIAAARRRRATAAEFALHVDAVDRSLAAAHAEDKGWSREALVAAARQAWADQRPEEDLVEFDLVAVVDKPGVAEDKAVFRVVGDRGAVRMRLGRAADGWRFEAFE